MKANRCAIPVLLCLLFAANAALGQQQRCSLSGPQDKRPEFGG
jgi:hypothetical protein